MRTEFIPVNDVDSEVQAADTSLSQEPSVHTDASVKCTIVVRTLWPRAICKTAAERHTHTHIFSAPCFNFPRLNGKADFESSAEGMWP